MKKKMVSMLLVLAMSVGLCACGGSDQEGGAGKSDGTEQAAGGSETSDDMDYTKQSAEIYDQALGDFYEKFSAAKQTDQVSERWALMAVAEAKLLETGVFTPLYTEGGRYSLSRVAPYSVNYALWGTDYERYHQALVCTEFIKADDRTEMKAKWNELRGTGTYEEWAKSYLEEKGYKLKSDYTIPYNADPTTWDIFASYLSSDSAAIINTYDGLYEYDVEGYIQPALATDYELSDDGCTYTFHLREGVKWVDSQGREVGEVKADDFVAGLQHLLDAQAGLEYLAGSDGGCSIVNADAYISGEVTDFAEVGVKAVDEYTLEYKLEAPCTFFDTMLGYSVFAPLCRSYYESEGGKFGSEYDASASDYTYGQDPTHIAYCGPYLVASATDANSIVYKANEQYWNADNINVKDLVWRYDDGTDVAKAFHDAVDGTVDYVILDHSTLEIAKSENLLDDYGFLTTTNSTTYVAYMNLNRSAFANANDETKAVSPQTLEDREKTKAAAGNVHFRRALTFGLDRSAYNAQNVGEELKMFSLRNSYTPANFVAFEEEVTTDVNGEQKTFPKGTYYGEIVQAQLDADEFPVVVWDKDADEGNGSGDGFDGWYNKDNAAAEMELAVKELAEQGITVDKDHPVYIDFPYNSGSELFTNRANAYKQSLENSFDGKVVVNLISCADLSEWQYCGYYADYGYDSNYDVYDLTGWIPDYGDPSSYLDSMQPDYAGYQTKCLGIY